VIIETRKYPDKISKIKQSNYIIDNSWKNEIEYVFNVIRITNTKKINNNKEAYNILKIIKNFNKNA
jgi:predicted nucleic acid-binding protein